jgi:hypothetical protein
MHGQNHIKYSFLLHIVDPWVHCPLSILQNIYTITNMKIFPIMCIRSSFLMGYTHTPYSLIYSTHNGDDAPQKLEFRFLAVIRTRSRDVGVVNTGKCFWVCLLAYLDALLDPRRQERGSRIDNLHTLPLWSKFRHNTMRFPGIPASSLRNPLFCVKPTLVRRTNWNCLSEK